MHVHDQGPLYFNRYSMKLGGRGRVAMPQPLHARFRQAGDRRRYIIFPMRDPLRLCIMSDTQADFFGRRSGGRCSNFLSGRTGAVFLLWSGIMRRFWA